MMKKANSIPRPQRITIRLHEHVVAALDAAAAALDDETGEAGADRSAVVERAVLEYLQRLKRERLLCKHAGDMVTTESGRELRVHSRSDQLRVGSAEQLLAFDTWLKEKNAAGVASNPGNSVRNLFASEHEDSGQLCIFALEEFKTRSQAWKRLSIRNFYPQSDGTWRPSGSIHLSRSLLNWLIESGQKAEVAAQAEASQNRARAHQARAARSPEEVAREAELRRSYVERYSKELVRRAVTLATRHRTRGKNYELSEHFTAWEWLDLCARADFGCLICGGQVSLEPHHRLPLHLGGSNTIDNIDPLCRACHGEIPAEAVDRSAEWLAEQQQLLEAFPVGTMVQRTYSKTRPGTIVEIIPAQRGRGPLCANVGHDGRPYMRPPFSAYWIEAKARIQWPGKKSTSESTTDLSDLVKV